MDARFKQAKKTDLEVIITIAKKTIDQSYRYFLGDETVENYLSSRRLEKYLTKNIDKTWVSLLSDKIVGFSICIENVIDFVLIDADYQRQGLGTQLLQHCETMLFENHSVIALESYEKNTKATDFYLVNDWTKTEKYRDPKSNAIKFIFRKFRDPQENFHRSTVIRANPYR